jgi:crotonobetainyl-CoA:carnitine CoA-transferase CaiB-like acyl-CoA transferase
LAILALFAVGLTGLTGHFGPAEELPFGTLVWITDLADEGIFGLTGVTGVLGASVTMKRTGKTRMFSRDVGLHWTGANTTAADMFTV